MIGKPLQDSDTFLSLAFEIGTFPEFEVFFDVDEFSIPDYGKTFIAPRCKAAGKKADGDSLTEIEVSFKNYF